MFKNKLTGLNFLLKHISAFHNQVFSCINSNHIISFIEIITRIFSLVKTYIKNQLFIHKFMYELEIVCCFELTND